MVKADNINNALQTAVQSIQQDMTSLERRISLLEQLTIRQRKNQIDQAQRRPVRVPLMFGIVSQSVWLSISFSRNT